MRAELFFFFFGCVCYIAGYHFGAACNCGIANCIDIFIKFYYTTWYRKP